MPDESTPNGRDWVENKKNILHQLEYVTDGIHNLQRDFNTHSLETVKGFGTVRAEVAEKLSDVKTEIAVLKTKAAMWGAVAAFIISAAVTIGSRFIK